MIPQEGTPIQTRTLEKYLTMISFLSFKAKTITRKLNHIVRVSATFIGIISTCILLFRLLSKICFFLSYMYVRNIRKAEGAVEVELDGMEKRLHNVTKEYEKLKVVLAQKQNAKKVRQKHFNYL